MTQETHTPESVKAAKPLYRLFDEWRIESEQGFIRLKDARLDQIASIIDQKTGLPEIIKERDRLLEINEKLRVGLIDCGHIMNITANQLCTAFDRSDLTGANNRLVECVIRTRTTLHETALAEPGGEKTRKENNNDKNTENPKERNH